MMGKRTGKVKKRRKSVPILLLVLVVLWILTLLLAPSEQEYVQTPIVGIPDLELPRYAETDIVVTHPGYTLLYDEKHEQARWVAYELTRSELYGLYERGDDFRSDPSIPSESASLDDYRLSGYDRGHLIPAADLSWSEEAMSGSFYFSNMSPQEGQFNRGIWSKLEATVRNFADTEGSIYVVTGPVLTDGPYNTIGDNEVSIPNQYYKVILDYREPELKSIGFLLPNEGSKKDLEDFATSVDEIETITGIDFFHRLPDPQEAELEREYDTNSWDFNTFQVSKADREAFNADPANAVNQPQKATGWYAIATSSLTSVLYLVKSETLNLIEIFVPKSTLKEALPFLY